MIIDGIKFEVPPSETHPPESSAQAVIAASFHEGGPHGKGHLSNGFKECGWGIAVRAPGIEPFRHHSMAAVRWPNMAFALAIRAAAAELHYRGVSVPLTIYMAAKGFNASILQHLDSWRERKWADQNNKGQRLNGWRVLRVLDMVRHTTGLEVVEMKQLPMIHIPVMRMAEDAKFRATDKSFGDNPPCDSFGELDAYDEVDLLLLSMDSAA